MAERFRIYGHRGSPKRFPENTIASFDECLRAGADGFETDLRLLSDRTAVLYHDDELDDVDVESLTFPQCAERGRMLARVTDLGRYAGRTSMILEVKRSQWEDALLEVVGQWPDVIVASFDHSTIADLHQRGAPFPLGITFNGCLVDVADYAARVGATWVFPNYRYIDEQLIASLHARGIGVIPYTPNRRREWERLRELGCDGVITDDPAEAVQWREGDDRS
jgi:glycerophosphoryl diester phosphodiesterase